MTMAEPTITRRTITILGTLGLGIFLIIILMRYTSIGFESVWSTVKQSDRIVFMGIMITSLFHFWLMAHKWKIVTHTIKPNVALGHGFFLYSVLISFIAQFLPMQLSLLTVRSLALRAHEDMSVTRSASSSLFEQLFDAVIPGVLFIPAFLVMTTVLSETNGLVLSVLMLVGMGFAAMILGNKFVLIFLAVAGKVPIANRIVKRLTDGGNQDQVLDLFQRDIITKLYFWSVLRYLNLLLRSYLVAVAAGLDIGFPSIAFANTLVILFNVISLTPASLGIAEWGWVGVLSVLGVSTELATEFALLNRVLLFASVVSVSAIIGFIYFGLQSVRKSRN